MMRDPLRWVWCGVLGVTLLGCGSTKHSDVESPFGPTATTYAMAQQVRWLDNTRFLVGRWDGSISVFTAPPDGSPTLTSALVMPDGAGVQMLVTHSPQVFISSADGGSLLVWRSEDGAEFSSSAVDYPEDIGVAVSGIFVTHGGEDHLITGHESGRMLIWSVAADAGLSLRHTVDLRMAEAIDYVHDDEPLRHIRGLADWRDGVVIAGSEDGGLHQVRLSDGAILSQRLFNPEARLGINDIAVHGDHLLAVNCAIDRHDHNVWLFSLHDDRIEHRDAANLLRDPDRDRIFAFDVITHEQDGEPLAAITTKEGLVWSVRFDDGTLQPAGHTALGRFDYGNAIDHDAASGRIAAAGISVRVVDLSAE